MERAQKTPRVQRDAPSGLASLPRHVSETVLRFVMDDPCSVQTLPTPRPLHAGALVSKAWFALVADIMSRDALACVAYDLDTPLRSAVLALRRDVILRRAYLTRLEVTCKPEHAASLDAFWHATLGHAPRLASLDFLSMVPSATAVEAASRHCPYLKRLVFTPLPLRARTDWPFNSQDGPLRLPATDEHDSMTVLTQAVMDALPRWAAHGGLRYLSFYANAYVAEFTRINPCITAIVQHCPQLASLQQFASSAFDHVMVRQQWWLGVDTWELFCRTCKHIEQLHWLPLPFATTYFEIFGRHVHAKLRALTFETSPDYDWARFLASADRVTRTEVHARGYSTTAVHPEAALTACPNLQTLVVKWLATTQHDDDETPTMNAEVFGDDFYEAVATHCTFVEKLSARCCGTMYQALATLTDRSLRALATLRYLRQLTLEGANVTAEGVFDFMRMHTRACSAQRAFDFLVANAANIKAFYSTVKGFLESMVNYDGDLPWLTRPTILVIRNNKFHIVDAAWSTEYLREFRILLHAAQAKYPMLQFRVVFWRLNVASNTFMGITDIFIKTSSATIERKRVSMVGVMHATSIKRIDDVFYNAYCHDSRRRMPGMDSSEDFSEDSD